MSKIGAFFNTVKAGVAKATKKSIAAIVANKTKSIIIGSALAVAIGGTATTIALVGKGHEHEPTAAVYENIVNATCTIAGSHDEVVYCADCGEEISRKSITDAASHSTSGWIIDKESTCKESGFKHKECKVCHEELKTSVIDRLSEHTPVIDQRVEPTYNTPGYTEGSHCGVCGEILVPQTIIPSEKSMVISETLTVNGNEITGRLSNSYHGDFDFTQHITVTNNSMWYLSSDYNCEYNIPTKRVTLQEGYNTYYIHVLNSDQSTDTYVVNIYVNHRYFVEFMSNGHHHSGLYVEEGDTIDAPTPNPSLAGYTFMGWKFDFSAPITSNTVIHANWNANGDTPYKVYYYLQNTDKDGYEDPIIVDCSGLTDTTAHAEQKVYDHFELDKSRSILSGNISGDGSLILEVYYTRNSYNIATNRNNQKGGTVTNTNAYPYNKEITLTATTNPGYTFLGWFEGEALASSEPDFTFTVNRNVTYTAKWKANTDTAYMVEYYLENVDKNGYEAPIVVELNGTTDETATAEQRAFEHFTFNASMSTMSGNIDGNGSLVLKVYYTRNQYRLSNANTGMSCADITGLGLYTYGATEPFVSTVTINKLGYEFVGWFCGEELLSTDTTYTFTAEKNVEARFAVKAEMSNFEFISYGLNYCTITGIKDKTVREIVVPDYVTEIESGAFSGCTSLEKITLPFIGQKLSSADSSSHFGYIFGANNYSYNSKKVPSSLKTVVITSQTHVKANAFYGCQSIKSITIPDSVTHIDEGAFAGCSSLESITLPFIGGSVKTETDTYQYPFGYIFGKNSYDNSEKTTQYFHYSSTTSVGGLYFYIPKSLKSVTVTGGNILYGAFYGCSNLTSITLLNDVTSIGDKAFYGCSNLTSVIIPSSVLEIGERVFEGCAALRDINIPNGVNKIGNYIFLNCTSLKNVYIPDSVTSIGMYTFSGCTSLENITIPAGITKISEYMFSGCSALKSISIPSNITQISNRAFSGCTSLTTVTVPSTVTSIGQSAFAGCTSLESITLPFVGAKVWDDVNTPQLPLGYIFGSESYADSVAAVQRYYAAGATNITTYTYYLPKSLKSVTITGGDILAGAFSGCSGLTSITFPDSLSVINDYTFYGCSSLTSINIPRGVTTIGNYAFAGCTGIDEIDIPDGVTKIGNYAFSGCTGLAEIAVPDGVTDIGAYAFENCTGLTNFIIPSAVAKIPGYTFSGCTSLTSMDIPDGVTYIGDSAFAGCTNLRSISIPGSVTEIRPSAFSGCSLLNGITIPMGVQLIQANTFRGCSSLTSIDIPTSVTGIGDYAFAGCSSLKAIVVPNTVTSIGLGAFSGCSGLESITLPFVGYISKDPSRTQQYPFGYIFGSTGYEGGVETKQEYYGSYTGITVKNTYYIPEKLKSVTINGGYILRGAFSGCSGLTNITLGDNVQKIVAYAFSGCTGLTDITIGKNVTSIDPYVFSECYSIRSFTVDSDNGYYQSIDGNLYSKDGKTLIRYAPGKTDATFSIPDGVTSIDNKAFLYAENLTTVYIPDSVTVIGSYAFSNCSSLTSITIPSGVTTIGDYAFSNCSSLTSITIPSGVITIGNYAFKDCVALEEIRFNATAMDDLVTYNYVFHNAGKNANGIEVIIGKNVTRIPAYLFYTDSDCIPKIIAIEFEEDSVCTYIGTRAFGSCSKLTNITIPNSVTEFGECILSGCSSLESITLPMRSYSIGYFFGKYSYRDSYSVRQNNKSYYIPSNLKNVTITDTLIPSDAFRECRTLTSITISNNATHIGSSAFYDCTGLTSIVIPDSVTFIGSYAFSGCTNLTNITIGASVKDIEQYAFNNCTSLKEIYFNATAMNDLIAGNYVFSSNEKISIGTKVVIGKDVTKIPAYLFYPSTGYSVNKVEIVSLEFEEESICQTIGSYAFYRCSLNGSVTIPESITDIGNYAFAECTSIKTLYFYATAMNDLSYNSNVFSNSIHESIVIGKNVTKIPAYLFGAQSNSAFVQVSKVEFEAGSVCQSIGEYAFSRCDYLKSISIPDTVTSIGNHAFYHCAYLVDIKLSANLSAIENYTFAECPSLTGITIPDNVTTIGNYAFSDCSNLANVNISDKVTYIGDYAFARCGITSAIISDSVTYIGERAFESCYRITNIVIGNKVTTIGAYAFNGCSKAESITIGTNVTSIGSYAFASCTSVKNIYFYATSMNNLAEYNNIFYRVGMYNSGYGLSLGVGVVIGKNVTKIPAYLFYVNSSNPYNDMACVGVVEFEEGSACTKICNSAFRSCYYLTEINIPNSVIIIEQYAFENCNSLPSIHIPGSVQSIEARAFMGCTSLTSITIGKGLRYIKTSAFYDCKNLNSIKYRGTEEEWNSISKQGYWDQYNNNGDVKINYTLTFNYTGE